MAIEEKDDKSDDQQSPPKATKHRSPNYPVIGLKKAMELAHTIHGKYRRALVPVNLAHELLGYKAHSGIGNQVVAALKAFGFIDVTGEGEKRQIQVNDAAAHIIAKGPDRRKLLKAASLKPAIYNELWQKYAADFPDDAIIKHYLLWDRQEGKFNPDVVDNFIADFRGSLVFAELLQGDIIAPADGQVETDQSRPEDISAASQMISRAHGQRRPQPPDQQGRSTMQAETIEVNYPVDAGQVQIAWPGSIGEDEITEVENWLHMMVNRMKRTAQLRKGTKRWIDSQNEETETPDQE